MNVYLLVFSSNNRFDLSCERLKKQAEKTNWFKKIIAINSDEYPHFFNEFFQNNKAFFEGNPKGFGLWIWKPFLVNWYLNNELNDDDILLYMDSGCEISYFGENIFNEYLNIVSNEGSLFFNTKFSEINWTKGEVLNLFPDIDIYSKQIQATFLFFKRCPKSLSITNEWLQIAQKDNYKYLNESISCNNINSKLTEHRHDQSILSLLVKSYKLKIINNDFNYRLKYYRRNSYILRFPIHAIRNKNSESILNDVLQESSIKKVNSLFSFLSFWAIYFYDESKLKLKVFLNLQFLKNSHWK